MTGVLCGHRACNQNRRADSAETCYFDLGFWYSGLLGTRLDTLRDGNSEFDDLCSMAGVSFFDAFFVHFCEQR